MPPPTFAVLRRFEQSIDDRLERLRRVVGQKGLNLLWLWWQAGQVIVSSAQESCLFGRAVRLEARVFEFRKNERVDRITHERLIVNRRDLGTLDRDKRPELLRLVID